MKREGFAEMEIYLKPYVCESMNKKVKKIFRNFFRLKSNLLHAEVTTEAELRKFNHRERV